MKRLALCGLLLMTGPTLASPIEPDVPMSPELQVATDVAAIIGGMMETPDGVADVTEILGHATELRNAQ
jgi:hypothetical protein